MRCGSLARFWRHLHSGRNPLCRTSDRVEQRLTLLCMIVAVTAMPVLTANSLTDYTKHANRGAEQQATRASTVAVLQEDAPHSAPVIRGPQAPVQARATWETPTGEIRLGSVPARSGATTGTEITVWIDTNGDLTDPPLTNTDAVIIAVLSATISWLGLTAALTAILCATRMVLNRVRYAAWDREWELFSRGGP